jgi:hypothetical protein
MKIQKKEFDWARPLKPLNLSKITAIALHHMEHATAGMDLVHKWHLDRKWKGFAYNYWIDFEGGVWEGRGLNIGGGLFDPLNDTVLSIGFQGDYDVAKTMPHAQFVSGAELIAYLRTTIPSINLVAGHKHWQDKSCPGKYFPLGEMIDTADKMLTIKDYEDISDWAKGSVLVAVDSGVMIGDDQGQFKPKDYITRQEIAVVLSRLLDRFPNNRQED